MQGILDERPFLVSLPINALKSDATFIPNTSYSHVIGSQKNIKAIDACNRLLRLFQIKGGGILTIDSNIEPGKGMASSSADIVAAIRATADSFNLNITEEIISAIASNIEPTDAVMYEGTVAYDYIKGKLIEKLGTLPALGLIGLDLGGVVDTIQFNQFQKSYDLRDKRKFMEAYDLVKFGIKNNDLSAICSASTISARINQRILPKQHFLEFEKVANLHDAGIIVGHSGTVLGIIFDPERPNIEEEYSRILKEISIIIDNPNILLRV
ncbi:hypothetical protein B1NLA3E_01990 [Bacillus sp. 1NLA3E]|nr:hypothetical protein B1NLA3E_01990 [Bacillus sp. 1NLA3E]